VGNVAVADGCIRIDSGDEMPTVWDAVPIKPYGLPHSAYEEWSMVSPLSPKLMP